MSILTRDENDAGCIYPIDKNKLALHKEEADDCVKDWSDFPCVTPEEEVWWAQVLTQAHTLGKEIEEEKERLKRPIIDDGRRIDKAFKEAQSSVAKLKALAQKKLAGPAQARFEAEAQAVLLANAASSAEEAHAALAAAPEHTKVEGVSSSRRWGFNVIDENEVPRAFLVVDGSAITAWMKGEVKAGRVPVLPGVGFYEEAAIKPTGKRKT